MSFCNFFLITRKNTAAITQEKVQNANTNIKFDNPYIVHKNSIKTNMLPYPITINSHSKSGKDPFSYIILGLFFQRISGTIDRRSLYFFGGSTCKTIKRRRRRSAKEILKEKRSKRSPRFSRRTNLLKKEKPIRWEDSLFRLRARI